jgi:hypothetical protein
VTGRAPSDERQQYQQRDTAHCSSNWSATPPTWYQ